jgi:hypothetical protein
VRHIADTHSLPLFVYRFFHSLFLLSGSLFLHDEFHLRVPSFTHKHLSYSLFFSLRPARKRSSVGSTMSLLFLSMRGSPFAVGFERRERERERESVKRKSWSDIFLIVCCSARYAMKANPSGAILKIMKEVSLISIRSFISSSLTHFWINVHSSRPFYRKVLKLTQVLRGRFLFLSLR